MDLSTMTGASSDFMTAFEIKEKRKTRNSEKKEMGTVKKQNSHLVSTKITIELAEMLDAFKLCPSTPDDCKTSQSTLLEHLCTVAIDERYPQVKELLKFINKQKK